MKEIILKIIRDGWPVSTAEILHDLAVMKSQGLLPMVAGDPPETLAELSFIVNELLRAGWVEKVPGGWKCATNRPGETPPDSDLLPLFRQPSLAQMGTVGE